jgi:hypothetical protein
MKVKRNRAKRFSKLGLNSKFKFGKYEGKKVGEIDDLPYINWMALNTNTIFEQEVFDKYNSDDHSPSI